MLAESDLQELVAFTTGNEPVLSVYLDTEPTNGNADVGKLRLRNMLKAINLPEDVSAVERYITLEYKWSGRGVAVFSSASRQFFRAYPLALPVRDMYHVGDRPSVQPLLDLFDNYGGYGVALVDKQGVRLFNFHLGEMREHESVQGEQVKHVKDGGASSSRGGPGGAAGQNHSVDETIDRNMRDSAESAAHFFEEKHVRRVVLGGTEDNVALFRSLLPKTWQSLVVGTFAVSKTASQNEVLQRTLQIGLEAERLNEARMVENLETRSAKGEGAVMGLEDTLKSVNTSRVQTLVLVENLHMAGYRCDSCGLLTSSPIMICPNCGGAIFKYPDVIELAISEVMRRGGGVQITHPHEAFIRAGSVGAMLRY
jgi:peptide subunit release factor 1 (eRF1)